MVDLQLLTGLSPRRRPLFVPGCGPVCRRLFVLVNVFMQSMSGKNRTFHRHSAGKRSAGLLGQGGFWRNRVVRWRTRSDKSEQGSAQISGYRTPLRPSRINEMPNNDVGGQQILVFPGRLSVVPGNPFFITFNVRALLACWLAMSVELRDMPCMKKVYRDERAVHWSEARNTKRF